RALCEWDVHLWCLGLTELLDIADIAEDSHDMPFHTRTGLVHRDTLAHWILAVQEEPHESFVDHGGALGTHAVTIVQRTALQHADPEGLEVSGRHHLNPHAWPWRGRVSSGCPTTLNLLGIPKPSSGRPVLTLA